MARYYGVTRSSDYLAHYGIKGMRWGVRKAIEKGNAKALVKHYRKAQRKLEKLKRNENIAEQKNKLEKSKKVAKVGLGVGLASTAAATGSHFLSGALSNAVGKTAKTLEDLKYANRANNRALDSQIFSARMDRHAAKKAGNKIAENQLDRELDALRETQRSNNAAYEQQKTKLQNKLNKDADNANRAELLRNITGAIGAAGLATAAVAGGKAAVHKYRMSAKGHAKATAKRKNWEKQMQEAFAGTQYDTKKRKRKR